MKREATKAEQKCIKSIESIVEYINIQERIIGVSTNPEKARLVNRSKSIMKMRKVFKYHIQMVIDCEKRETLSV